jgi:hypothetical protein
MKRTLSVTVRGKTKEWAFNFEGDPKDLAEWRADGLEVIEIGGSIPAWTLGTPLAPMLLAWQSFWQWLRLW